MVGGDVDTRSEHTQMEVGLNLLKNSFGSVANSGSPCALGAGLLQRVIYFIPFHTSLVIIRPNLPSIPFNPVFVFGLSEFFS